MKPVRTHTFNGRKYTIIAEKLDGYCDQFDLTAENARTLIILPDLNTRKGLITAIHEALHAEDWTVTEEPIERVSKEIGDFLWRLGYRIEKQ